MVCPNCGKEQVDNTKFCRACGHSMAPPKDQGVVSTTRCAYHPYASSIGFCTSCGRAICAQCKSEVKGIIYCSSCVEQSLSSVKSPIAKERNSTNEHIIGTIEVFKHRKGGQDFLLLCFTPSRVIVAKVGRFNSLAWAFLLGLGNVFFFPLARRRARATAEQVTRLPVDSILKADKTNFEIVYEDVNKVEMKRPGAIIGWPITITTGTTKHVFGILQKNEFEAQWKLVRSVLGSKLNIL